MNNASQPTIKLIRGLVVAGLALLAILILLPERADSAVVVGTSPGNARLRGRPVLVKVSPGMACTCGRHGALSSAAHRRSQLRQMRKMRQMYQLRFSGKATARYFRKTAPTCRVSLRSGAEFRRGASTRPVVRRPRPAHNRHVWVPGYWVKDRGRSRVWVSGHWLRAQYM